MPHFNTKTLFYETILSLVCYVNSYTVKTKFFLGSKFEQAACPGLHDIKIANDIIYKHIPNTS